jgi:hypothetical protein
MRTDGLDDGLEIFVTLYIAILHFIYIDQILFGMHAPCCSQVPCCLPSSGSTCHYQIQSTYKIDGL